MIVSDFTTTLRRRYGDIPVKHRDVIDGDGVSTVYKSKYNPVLESSYTLYFNTTPKTEGVADDYTIDLDTGDIVLAQPTSNEIRFQYKSVNFRNLWWLETIQSSIRSLGDEFFTSVIREELAVSANAQVITCPTGCIKLTEVLDSNGLPIAINKWYDRRSNQLILGKSSINAQTFLISYLKRITIPTDYSDELDLEENWLELLELKAGALYARARAIQLAQIGNVSVEEGHLSIQGLRQLANDNEVLFQQGKRRLKPLMPSYNIPYYVHGGGFVKQL